MCKIIKIIASQKHENDLQKYVFDFWKKNNLVGERSYYLYKVKRL